MAVVNFYATVRSMQLEKKHVFITHLTLVERLPTLEERGGGMIMYHQFDNADDVDPAMEQLERIGVTVDSGEIQRLKDFIIEHGEAYVF